MHQFNRSRVRSSSFWATASIYMARCSCKTGSVVLLQRGMTGSNKNMESNIAAIVVIFLSVSALAAEQTPSAKLRAGQFSVAIGEQGLAGELQRPDGRVLPATAGTAEVRYGTLRRPLHQPAAVNRTTDTVSVEYKLPGEAAIHVNITYRLQAERDVVVLVREIEVRRRPG